MKKQLLLLFGLIASQVGAQPNYKFSKDILAQIEQDSLAWKYQQGATELSFGGYYQEVLKTWDKNGLAKPRYSREDSMYFTKSKQLSAKEHIIQASKRTEVVIINEAHHVARHRTFTRSLLKELYDNGYRYLGLEALFDSSINQRKFPVMESGYYTMEPEFGNLLSESLKLGFTLFGYEASQEKNGADREIEQAQNIQRFMENNRNGKVLIHCGYAHAFENDYPAWGKAMAGRLKENTGIDPLTIDQTMILERADAAYNHLFMELNRQAEAIVLMDENGQVFNGKSSVKQTDMVLIHPKTAYFYGRPNWLLEAKKKYTIPAAKIPKNNPALLFLAYRQGEFEQGGVPADIVEITDPAAVKPLFLAKGAYTLVLYDQHYNKLSQFDVKVK